VTKIAILGWGSLLWDNSALQFEQQHDDWKPDGPVLKLEFSRKSVSRLNALTLVIDAVHGQKCQVAYALSRRRTAEEAKADLRAREKTAAQNIGYVFADGPRDLLNSVGVRVSPRGWSEAWLRQSYLAVPSPGRVAIGKAKQ
jgi:hypothetical protein